MKGKKGFQKQIMIVIIIGLVFGMLIIFSYAGMLFFPILTDSFGTLSGILQEATSEANTGNQALENATQASFVQANRGVQQLEWIVFTMFVFLMITMLIMCFYVRTYPFLIFVWILMILILTFGSLFLANAYQDLRSGELSEVYTSWENTDYYLQWLPHIVVIIGVIGGIIMFVLASKQPEAEGVYI